MAAFNLTVEDCSPLVTYEPAGAWQDAPVEDPLVSRYSGQNFHSTSTSGATASITFHGTGITIFGGKRPGYGQYTLEIDGETVVAGDARGPTDSTEEVLATINGLLLGNHRAVLTHTDELPMDIDSFTIHDLLGSPGSQISVQNFDDTSPAISYNPTPEAWILNSQNLFQNNTLHFSEAPGASVSMPFAGDAVAVYGTISPDHAGMKITVDGQEITVAGGANGHVSRLHTKMLLYFRSDLGPGTHTLTMAANNPSSDAPFIDLDAIAVLSAPSLQAPETEPSTIQPVAEPGTTSPAGSPSGGLETQPNVGLGNGPQPGSGNVGTNGQPGTGLQNGATLPASSTPPPQGITKAGIVGAAVGGAVGLIVFLIVIFLLLRKRRQWKENRFPKSPDLPMQQDPKSMEGGMITGPLENSVFVFPPTKKPIFAAKPAAFPVKRTSAHSLAGSYYSSPMSGHRPDLSVASTSPLIRSVRFDSPSPSPPSSPPLRKPVPALTVTSPDERTFAALPQERLLLSPPRRPHLGFVERF
ncbi:hypothetical protein FA15DRAFT_670034 [Coprinopsis marcescibilis]|uniref:Uncharacterized protein n=1 Tax=Coprinopsis marcescibilis TaxID=230819 RepID=A0A5C3L6U5_COPMA|nr:hypothetical protein FA15DRAFT_670034 [Coprinopsis marcescibilis]